MNQYKYLWILLLASGLCFSCKEDWEETPLPISNISLMTISENMTSDGGNGTKEEQYLYEDQKLISHVTTQVFGEYERSLTTTLTYSVNQVTIAYQLGNVAVYTLGANGYATNCTYRMGEQIREYTFTYSDGHLTKVNEKIDGNPFMSNTLVYHNGDLTSVIVDGINETTCTASGIVNYSQLPFMLLANIHPLSLHLDAMYAHILGKPTQHLVESYKPVIDEAETPNREETTYEYKTDEQGKVTGIKEKTAYTGLIYDGEGKAHLTTNSSFRNLTISYQ